MRFNVYNDCCEQMLNMHIRRVYHSLVVAQRRLYTIGGYSAKQRGTYFCERNYLGAWSKVAANPIEFKAVSGTAWQEKIFVAIVGSRHGIYVFSPLNDQWRFLHNVYNSWQYIMKFGNEMI
jgi:hypothetical protein